MPDPESGLKPRRRWRALLVSIAATLAAGAVFVMLSGPGLRIDAWARGRLRAELGRAFGRPVSVAAVHVSLLGVSLEARDIVIGAAPPSTGRVLEVPALSATVVPWPLLRGRIELEEVRIERPRVFLSRTAYGLDGPFPLAPAAGEGRRAAPAKSAFRIALHHLELIEGLASFEDRTVPFWCTAEEAEVSWEGDESGNGSGVFRSTKVRGGSGTESLAGQVRAQAKIAAWNVEADADLTLGESFVSVTGRADLSGPPGTPPLGQAEVRFKLAGGKNGGLIPLLMTLPEPVEGSLEGRGTLRLAGGRATAEGHVRGEGLRYADLEVASLDADLRVSGATGATIEVRSLEARTIGGTVKAAGVIEPRRGGAIRATASAENLSANRVLSVLGLESPLSGLASGDGTVAFRLGDPHSLEVEANVTVRPGAATPVPGHWPLSGTGTVAIRGGKVVFLAERAQAGATTTLVRIEKTLSEPPLLLVLSAESASLADTASLLDGFLKRQPSRPEVPWDASHLQGAGTLEGEVTFEKSHPIRGRGSFAFREFAYETIGAESVSGAGTADGTSFRVTETRAEKGGGVLLLEGVWPEEGSSVTSRITGRFDRWPAADALVRLGAPKDASAQLTGRMEYRGSGDQGAGEADLMLSQASVSSLAFSDGRFLATVRGTRIEAPRIELSGTQARLTARGSYDLGTGSLSGRLEASGVDAQLARPVLHGLPLSGHASLTLDAETHAGGTAWTLSLIPEPDLAYGTGKVSGLEMHAEGDAKTARFTGLLGEHARFSGSVGLAAPHEGQGRVELDAVPAATLLALPGSTLAGSIGGEVGGEIVWSGSLDDLSTLSGAATLMPVHIAVGTESLEASRPAKLSLSGGIVRLEDVELEGGGGHIVAMGTIPVDGHSPLGLDLSATLDLGSLSAFVSGLAASGTVQATLHASGEPADPDLSGEVSVEGGRMRFIGFPLLADRIETRARIGRGEIVADDITAVLGGGEAHGSGRVELDGMHLKGWRLETRVTNASLRLPEGFRGLYNGTLRWEGKAGETPVLTGDLELARGTWQQDFGLDRFSFGGRGRQPIMEVKPPVEGLSRTTLAVAIHAEDNVWLHNDLADTEGSLDLRLDGTIARPAVSGRFDSLEGGEMRFRRVRYEIGQAAVLFPGGQRFNPEFDIVAETHVREYDVRMHLFGNLDRVDYELTSNPPLPEREILSLLLTGTAASSDQLAGGTGQVQGTAANVVGGEIGGLVGGKLEHLLGFEEIRIDPLLLQGTADPTARVTLARRLKKILVRTSIALNSSEAPITQVEYQLNRKLRLVLERGELGSIGGDVRFATRFRAHSSKAEEAPPGGASSKAVPRIDSIMFQGEAGEPPETLRRIASLRGGQKFTHPLLVEATDHLRRHYVKKSYLQAFIRASTKEAAYGGMAIEFTIERGPKVFVRIEGAGVYEKRIRESLESLWTETSFGGDVVGEAEDRIQQLLQDAGYYTCYVRALVEDQPGEKRLTFRIDTGEKVRVDSVAIEGESAITESEIRRQVLTGEESLFRRDTLKPLTLSADVEAVENLYRSRGFLQASARPEVALSPDGERAWVKILVTEGTPSRLRHVRLQGNVIVDDAALRERIQSHDGDSFSPVRVAADLESIQTIYDEKGFPEAQIEEQIVTDGEWVDLAYEISEGSRKTARRIEIEGTEFTKDSVIRRSVPLKEGDPISRAAIHAIQHNLTRTGLFRDVGVSYADLPGTHGGQVLRIKVREADNIILGLGAGFDTENGPRGSVEIADSNLWGYGRYLGLSTLYGRKLQRVQVTVKDPRLFQRDWTTILGTFYEKRQRESFTQRGVGSSVVLERKTSRILTHLLRYTLGVSEVFDLSVSERTFHEAEPKLDLGRLRLASAGYTLVRDTRNDPLNATRGAYASGDFRVFAKPLGSEKRFSKLFLQESTYFNLPFSFTYVTSARVGLASQMATGEPLPLQERYFAGGDSSVRGFGQDLLGSCERGTLVPIRNDRNVTDCTDNKASRDSDGDGMADGSIQKYLPVGGQALIVLNNELRRPVYKSFSALAFWDSGSTFLRPGDINVREFRNTLGLGLRLETPVGPLRLEYGRKLDRLRRESRGEFVLAIGQSF